MIVNGEARQFVLTKLYISRVNRHLKGWLLERGGFHLIKWHSDDREAKADIPKSAPSSHNLTRPLPRGLFKNVY